MATSGVQFVALFRLKRRFHPLAVNASPCRKALELMLLHPSASCGAPIRHGKASRLSAKSKVVKSLVITLPIGEHCRHAMIFDARRRTPSRWLLGSAD